MRRPNKETSQVFFQMVVAFPPEGWGGTPHTKEVGMLVVSLRGVNFGFWSHLGCSGQNAIIFSREGLVYGCTLKKWKNLYIACVLTWSLLGVKKNLGHTQIGLL